MLVVLTCAVFFFNDTATTEIYTLSLHDALPIFHWGSGQIIEEASFVSNYTEPSIQLLEYGGDRQSTRLNSRHGYTSYAVLCLETNAAPDQSHRLPMAHPDQARPGTPTC